MIISVTSIHLKSPFAFFSLANKARLILKQLQHSNCRDFKKKGWWRTHYTLTTWEGEAEMKAFASKDAHLKAMKSSKDIADIIQVYTYEADELPSWKEAITLLNEKGQKIHF